MSAKLIHYSGTLMYVRGHTLSMYVGGTKACDNGTTDQATVDRKKVTCARCLKKLAYHDAYENEPQPEIARKARASLKATQEKLEAEAAKAGTP